MPLVIGLYVQGGHVLGAIFIWAELTVGRGIGILEISAISDVPEELACIVTTRLAGRRLKIRELGVYALNRDLW